MSSQSKVDGLLVSGSTARIQPSRLASPMSYLRPVPDSDRMCNTNNEPCNETAPLKLMKEKNQSPPGGETHPRLQVIKLSPESSQRPQRITTSLVETVLQSAAFENLDLQSQGGPSLSPPDSSVCRRDKNTSSMNFAMLAKPQMCYQPMQLQEHRIELDG